MTLACAKSSTDLRGLRAVELSFYSESSLALEHL